MPIPLGVLAVAGAGAAGGTYELLETVIPSGSSGTIEFLNIPQTYKHLQLRMVIRHDEVSSANVEDCSIRFNGATGNVYAIHFIESNASSVTSTAYASQTIMFGAYTNAPASSTSSFAGTVLDILDYSATTKYKTLRSFSGSATSSGPKLAFYSGLYQATTAVSSIQILSPNTVTKPFRSASRFSLYGIRG